MPEKDAAATSMGDQPGAEGTADTKKELVENVDSITKQLSKVDLIRNLFGGGGSSRTKTIDDHQFWKTQPVVKPTDKDDGSRGPIESSVTIDDVPKEPHVLPEGYQWSTVDILDEAECKEVYTLLCENYVEDSESLFRFDYSPEFLKWALMPPHWKKEWHVGIREVESKVLVGFISGIPSTVKMHAKHTQNLVEINFLCVRKDLRSKRFTPSLIQEVTRRVNLEGIFQAAYTVGKELPTPYSVCRYYHRSLNPKKLIDVGFSYLPKNQTITRQIRLLKVPDTTTLNMRPLEPKDIPKVVHLLNEYNKKYTVTQQFTEEEGAHWFIPKDKVIYSYVAEDPNNHKITDFVSFYMLPSSVIGKSKYSHVYAAYLFYYFPKGQGQDPSRLTTLIRDALTLANKEKFDVFNCLTLAQNNVFLEELKFAMGDGDLFYYFYNYRAPTIPNDKMNFVLL